LDLLFRNGLVVTDGMEINADLGVRGGVIRAIGDLEGLPAAQTIDCTGKVLLPGAVDLGVNLLENGDFDPESGSSFALASRDAALGGVTTIIATMAIEEMENTADSIRKQSEADGARAAVDFGYHLRVADWNDQRARQAREAVAGGIASFWVVRTDKAAAHPAPALLYTMLADLPEDSIAIVSPWDAALCSAALQRLQAKCAITDGNWSELLPDSIEAAFVAQAAQILAGSRARVLIHGLSSAASVAALAAARERNPRLLAAVALPHLLFSDGDSTPRAWPPIRAKADQQALYTALEDGLISAVLSEHKPRTPMESLATARNGKLPPAGMTTLKHFLPLLHSEGTLKWRLGLGSISLCACADPAKLAGLYPRKGTLQPGSDADIVILDPMADRPTNPLALTGTTKLDFLDPISSVPLKGAVQDVYLRGTKIVSQQKLVEESRGAFLTRRVALK